MVCTGMALICQEIPFLVIRLTNDTKNPSSWLKMAVEARSLVVDGSFDKLAKDKLSQMAKESLSLMVVKNSLKIAAYMRKLYSLCHDSKNHSSVGRGS